VDESTASSCVTQTAAQGRCVHQDTGRVRRHQYYRCRSILQHNWAEYHIQWRHTFTYLCCQEISFAHLTLSKAALPTINPSSCYSGSSFRKVMVTYNIETELDIANGARGTAEKILVENIETSKSSTHMQSLRRPPLRMLVRLLKDTAVAVPGLDPGVVPIRTIRNRFQVQKPDGKKLTLCREQLPLTPSCLYHR
jgi:hypothetical protein